MHDERSSGNASNMSASTSPSPGRRPIDGPAAIFEADEHVATLLSLQNNTVSDARTVEEFGLVVVAGWPPNLDQIERPYDDLLASIRQCFQEDDLTGSHPPVYLYPSRCLHVTVATMHSISQQTRDPGERIKLERHWRDVVVGASRRNEWPTKPLELVVETAQIGSRAGILLWNEMTGGLDRMRSCLAAETAERRGELDAAGIQVNTMSIPGIVHSTFLRFYEQPKTTGETVQDKFREFVTPQLKTFFSSPIVLQDVKFVCERIPYMHIPNDDYHVLESFSFQDS